MLFVKYYLQSAICKIILDKCKMKFARYNTQIAMALLALRKPQIEMYNCHDEGWTMFCYFQCNCADEHNASMQLARESFMVAVQKRDLVENYFAVFSLNISLFLQYCFIFSPKFPSIATLLCFPQHISPIATILQFPPSPTHNLWPEILIRWTGNIRKPKPGRYYSFNSVKYTGNTR